MARLRWKAEIAPVAVMLLLLLLGSFLGSPRTAHANRASTGQLAFHPCTKCHPVTLGPDGKPTRALPIGLDKHEIELEAHDILGKGDKACLACHDDPARNPGMLVLPDASLVDITGDVSKVCQRCHFEKYAEWKAGVHGNGLPKCSAGGCHNPHTPSWIYVGALPPFQGTGFEANAVGPDREPFKPMASPPVPPFVETPTWLAIVASLGLLASVGMISFLTLGRFKR